MAQERWICISRTIQQERSNELAPQKCAVVMPCLLSAKGNNWLKSDFSGLLLCLPFSSCSQSCPMPSFNSEQIGTSICIFHFCISPLNLHEKSSSPQHRRALNVFLQRWHTMSPGPSSFARQLLISVIPRHHCVHLVYMLLDIAKFN